jgi:energy-converting hydrogenase Eha subunit C
MTLLLQIVADVFGDIGVIFNYQYPQRMIMVFSIQAGILSSITFDLRKTTDN